MQYGQKEVPGQLTHRISPNLAKPVEPSVNQRLLLRQTPKSLEGDPSERPHLLRVGREESEWGRRTIKGTLPGEHLDSGTPAASVPLFAAPSCTAGT